MTTGDVPIREYIDLRVNTVNERLTEVIESRDSRVDLALVAIKESSALVNDAYEKRIGELNQFRAQNHDQESRYAQNAVVDEKFKWLEEKIKSLEGGAASNHDRITKIEAKEVGGRERISGIYALAAFFGTILVLIAGLAVFFK